VPVDTEDLARLLGSELKGTVTDLVQLSGGASRITRSFTLTPEGESPRQLIVQVDRGAPSPFGTGVGTEADLLRAAARVGAPVPGVVASGVGDGGQGFLVTERLSGETIARRILRDEKFAVARSALTRQCAAALAAIHRIDPAEVSTLPKRDRLSDPLALLDALGVTRPVLELAVRWLARHPVLPGGEVVVHGDFRMGNLMVNETGLVGVLDWELAHRGDPIEDLGWLCSRSWRFGGAGHVGGFGDADELRQRYADEGGIAVTAEQLRWWEAWAAVKWAAICALQASAHLSGHTRSVELATIGRRVCESEWDFLLASGIAGGALLEASGEADDQESAPFGRPTARELVTAVRESLELTVEGSGSTREKFEARVARNALAIVERELARGPRAVEKHQRRLADLGFGSDRDVAIALRSGALDHDLERVGAVLAQNTVEELMISSPAHLAHFREE
jgi:aminoglycoside phosphotransferase (APT) family kinase protein